jgi:hypothetical protein
LASSETEWQRLASTLRINDANALANYRQRYSEGIVRRSPIEEEADAHALYLVIRRKLQRSARKSPDGSTPRKATAAAEFST